MSFTKKVVLLFFMGIFVLLWLKCRDDALSPLALNMLEEAQPGMGQVSDAFWYLSGMDAPQDCLPMEWVRIERDYLSQSAKIKDDKKFNRIMANRKDEIYTEMKKYRLLIMNKELLKQDDEGKLLYWETAESALLQFIENNCTLLDRANLLQSGNIPKPPDLTAFNNIEYPDFLTNLISFTILKQAECTLNVKQGNEEELRANLVPCIHFLRFIMSQKKSLFDTLIFERQFINWLAFCSYLLDTKEWSEEFLMELESELGNLNPQELSLSYIGSSELRRELDLQKKINDMNLFARMWNSMFYKPNRSLNQRAENLKILSKEYSFVERLSSNQIMLKEDMTEPKKQGKRNPGFFQILGSNWMGELFNTISSPSYTRFIKKILTDQTIIETSLRKLRLKIKIKLQKVSPENMSGFLNLVGPELMDPVTLNPMLWDAKHQVITNEWIDSINWKILSDHETISSLLEMPVVFDSRNVTFP